MKKLSLSVIFFISCIASQANNKRPPVSVLSINSDIFYFKVAKSFIGATVEVFGAEGELKLSDKVNRHKAIIDFYEESAGKYTIVLKKDGNVMNFVYEKMDERIETDGPKSITITQ
jgi:hypothetical protein